MRHSIPVDKTSVASSRKTKADKALPRVCNTLCMPSRPQCVSPAHLFGPSPPVRSLPGTTTPTQVMIGGWNQLRMVIHSQIETNTANLLGFLFKQCSWYGTEVVAPARQRMNVPFIGHFGWLAPSRCSTRPDRNTQPSGPGPMTVPVPEDCATTPDPYRRCDDIDSVRLAR